jgi:ubiquinone/menaquinone biosynthesis C-methylase UbiE
MLDRGKESAIKNLIQNKYNFLETDINKWSTQSTKYDVVIASHSLHHFVELELLFKKIN